MRHGATLYLVLAVPELANCGSIACLPGDLSVALYQAQMCYFQPIGAVTAAIVWKMQLGIKNKTETFGHPSTQFYN